jgi:hypothetical protein
MEAESITALSNDAFFDTCMTLDKVSMEAVVDERFDTEAFRVVE